MAEKNNGSWFTAERTRYIVYVIIFILASVPLLVPLNLPLEISPNTQSHYDVIEALNAGDLVIFYWNEGTAQWGEMGPPGIVQLQHVLNQDGVKVIIFSAWPESPALFESSLRPKLDLTGKEYGRDWVNLGYFPGGETAIAALATDPHSLAKEDHYGTPVGELPIMDEFNSGEDIALIMGNAPGGYDLFMNQFQSKWETPIIWATPAAVYPSAVPFAESGQLIGLLNSLRGGAEYEKLINMPGRGLSAMDAMSALYVLVMVLIIIGNVNYYLERRNK